LVYVHSNLPLLRKTTVEWEQWLWLTPELNDDNEDDDDGDDGNDDDTA